MTHVEALEAEVLRKENQRKRKRKPKMKVSGKSVLTLKRIIAKKGRG